jgi:hypothetical protein
MSETGIGLPCKGGLQVTGTLGLLDLAAQRGLVDFAQAIQALERTTFRRPDALLNALLRKHQKRDYESTASPAIHRRLSRPGTCGCVRNR